jgi:exosortase family protein XrtM
MAQKERHEGSGPHGVAARTDSAGGQRRPAVGSPWVQPFRAVRGFGRRHLVLRFIVGVILLMGAFYALYLPKWEFAPLDNYLRWNLTRHAQACGAVLNGLAEPVDVYPDSQTVRSQRLREKGMQIVRGCDALEPAALFLAAVIAFPAGLRRKLLGALVGIAIIELTNVVRMVSLFYVLLHWPEHFKMIHEEIWMSAFIVIAVAYFAVWALWATKPFVVKGHAGDS